MFRLMTDAEYDTYLQIRLAFPPRLQAIFDAAEFLAVVAGAGPLANLPR
jgi:hypothetical protein